MFLHIFTCWTLAKSSFESLSENFSLCNRPNGIFKEMISNNEKCTFLWPIISSKMYLNRLSLKTKQKINFKSELNIKKLFEAKFLKHLYRIWVALEEAKPYVISSKRQFDSIGTFGCIRSEVNGLKINCILDHKWTVSNNPKIFPFSAKTFNVIMIQPDKKSDKNSFCAWQNESWIFCSMHSSVNQKNNSNI